MFYIYRCTTQQLEQSLNNVVESGDTVVQPVHVGGRDWVLICRKGVAAADSFAEAIQEQTDELRAAQADRRVHLKKAADLMGPSA